MWLRTIYNLRGMILAVLRGTPHEKEARAIVDSIATKIISTAFQFARERGMLSSQPLLDDNKAVVDAMFSVLEAMRVSVEGKKKISAGPQTQEDMDMAVLASLLQWAIFWGGGEYEDAWRTLDNLDMLGIEEVAECLERYAPFPSTADHTTTSTLQE